MTKKKEKTLRERIIEVLEGVGQIRDQKIGEILADQILELAGKEKLENLIDEINKLSCIYDIHFCKAGWGFMLYNKEKDEGDWRKALSVDRYYPTLREATEKTLEALKEKLKKEI